MATVAVIINGSGLDIDTCHGYYPNKSKLVLYKVLIHCNSRLKQLYSSNKMVRFSYKGGCGVRECTHIKAFKTRAGLV